MVFFLGRRRQRFNLGALLDLEEEGSVEREHLDLPLFDRSVAELANEHLLLGIDDLAQTGLADAMSALGQLSWHFCHCESVKALTALFHSNLNHYTSLLSISLSR